jgi:hypothetical protein
MDGIGHIDVSIRSNFIWIRWQSGINKRDRDLQRRSNKMGSTAEIRRPIRFN